MLKPLFAALLLTGCGNTPPASDPTRPLTTSPPVSAGSPAASAYNFTRPAVTYAVPPELQELSGHTLVGDEQLAGIEDESGTLYFYNLRTQRLDSTVQFGPKGDYEDVARVPGGYLILRSDGTLFKRSGRVTTTYATGLSAANEPEGLTYDASSQTLLVACKGEPGAGLGDTKRAVYRLNPTSYRIEPTPAYVLDIEAILARSPDAARRGKAAKKAGRLSQFAPSAVAVHPRTHHVFVLSARGNDLVELDAQGRLVAAQTLDPARFPQPEGLAFAPNGDLLVSSEAGSKKGQGRLYRFTETPAQP
ncbi:SdiA-regulated domain-containing protein [Hymenobacter profundi]|uniref:SdiA-regulated domain-containing protein n=1 Tax=Hymenobacter profundi TaxID=1982110 RepID=A0ABS6WU91_9BACT|nr:SdiA-regulated domain-containing protein [Hymenobacter profundi]MBW3127149.1 SdiA-regulated domain-containing protein [Hymenobacter profundi]